jgi:class 3 adenylate cyclase
MELKQVILVTADISGYTKFINRRTISLLHAEEIITSLIEAIIDKAEYPLILNKLEGDALLLFAELKEDASRQMKSIMAQVHAFFDAFEKRAGELSESTASCDCDACTGIHKLRLKAFIHRGEIAVKKIRQFEELAGEPVILIHRLMKNSLKSSEYILMTRAVYDLCPELASETEFISHYEECDEFGRIECFVHFKHHQKETQDSRMPAAPVKRQDNLGRNLKLIMRIIGLSKPKMLFFRILKRKPVRE